MKEINTKYERDRYKKVFISYSECVQQFDLLIQIVKKSPEESSHCLTLRCHRREGAENESIFISNKVYDLIIQIDWEIC